MIELRLFGKYFGRGIEEGEPEILSISDNKNNDLMVTLEDAVGERYGELIVTRTELKTFCVAVMDLIKMMEDDENYNT